MKKKRFLFNKVREKKHYCWTLLCHCWRAILCEVIFN